MKINKIFLSFSLLIFFATAVQAIEVAERELETVTQDAVVFENYTGPHSVINTIEEINKIGSSIAEQISRNIESSAKAGSSEKYQIIHAIDPNEKDKLDADIFIIGSTATVDHITNVRRIISSYLSSTYGYSKADADTVATFVTVYNAVYRGKLDYFSSKYKKVVTDKLTADKAGIALSYREWPGKTQILIPLNDVRGGLSSVDTSVISDKQVVKSMQEEDDKGVDSRKQMVDIKEREAETAQEKATQAQKKATEETAKLKEEQAKTVQATKEAEQAKKDAEQAKITAQENPKDKEAQKVAEEKQAVAEEKQAEAQEQAQKTQEQAQKTQEAKEEASKAQDIADTKRSEAQSERTSIAQDQQQIIKEQTANQNAPTVYGLRSIDELGVMSSLVKMNAQTGNVIKESPVTVIRSRTIYDTGENYAAIAGTNLGNGAVKLVLLDKENMEIKKESDETLSETSVLTENSGFLYCIVKDGKDYFLGKFTKDLTIALKSPEKVKPATPITVTSNGILVTAITGRPILLSTKNLSRVVDQTGIPNAK
ncbi:P83/100 family protein [Treponema pectinovorum]|uniref:P83/100 family protein n=1 Tax=Treponema pectinovorum TaxID=164 RepID=UPI0011C74677|nr:P83/100 family protein [Treponema pectinovorum]